jgi:hypothetical protein
MWRRFIVCLLLLWLPLQGLAALTMPFCRHAEQSSRSAATAHDVRVHDAHAHAGHVHDPRATLHAGAADAPGAGTLACNDCGACHLACAPAVPSHGLDAAASPPGTPQPGPTPSAPPAVVLDQPNPPPLIRG